VITEAEHNLIRNAADRVDAAVVLGLTGASAADAGRNPDACMAVGGSDAPSSLAAGFNFQLAYGSQSPVSELPPSKKGFHDAMGNAWEWAEDHYAAFPGFKVHPFYEDFSAPCFAGKHQLVSAAPRVCVCVCPGDSVVRVDGSTRASERG
jgi:formylglycine-generating enzyme required for sulfatase activity